MSKTTNTKLTKQIYEAMQIPYLSERHDAIKSILLRERLDDVERLQQSDMKLLRNEALAKHKAELEAELSRLSEEGL